MSFPDAVKICLNKYVDFSGRARRSEYWWWFLFTLVVGLVAGILDGIFGLSNGFIGVFTGIAYLAMLLPSLAVGARRLHDTSKSGWLQLLAIIPFVGGLILIVLFVMPSHGDNQYGPAAGSGGQGFGGPAPGGGPGYGEPGDGQPGYGQPGYGQPPSASGGPDYGNPPPPPPQGPSGT
jgi:uncharacterized membrane protein YhaH (DUF805 family)